MNGPEISIKQIIIFFDILMIATKKITQIFIAEGQLKLAVEKLLAANFLKRVT